MINFLSDLFRNKRFERNVSSTLSLLESRIENLNERIRVLESTVVSQANTVASLTKSSDSTTRPDSFPDKSIANGKLPTKKAATAGVSGYRTGSDTSRHRASYADDSASYQQATPSAGHHNSGHHHHHHDSGLCHNSLGDTGGYDSGCSDSSFSSGSCD